MQDSQPNSAQLNNLLKKSIPLISVMGISALISLPVFSQAYYPPMVFFQPTAYPNYPQRSGTGDLMDSLEGDTNYENLVYELKEAGLVEKLKQEELTVLAPSDEAFNTLSDEILNKFHDRENRIKLLQYHLVAGKVTEEDLKRGEIVTLAGEVVKVSSEENLTLNGAEAVFPPTITQNGVIIQISQVLLPPGF